MLILRFSLQSLYVLSCLGNEVWTWDVWKSDKHPVQCLRTAKIEASFKSFTTVCLAMLSINNVLSNLHPPSFFQCHTFRCRIIMWDQLWPFSQVEWSKDWTKVNLGITVAFESARRKTCECGSKLRCIIPWNSLYTIFGHGGWLKRQRHVLICALRSSSLSPSKQPASRWKRISVYMHHTASLSQNRSNPLREKS